MAADGGAPQGTTTAVDQGNYEIIRDRLKGQGDRLQGAAEALDAQRRKTFGSVGMVVLGTERLRTENNCIPADIVQVGDSLLFGYNVFLGLKRTTTPADVFSLQRFEKTDQGFAFHEVTDEKLRSFLTDRSFHREFDELYQYYKDARLVQLRVTESRLLAVFQTGATVRDVKVLRWALDPNGAVTYVDNRGERDHVSPPAHDFTWTRTTREDHVRGRHPHVNILDTVFVETIGGDLTVKVENNTETGSGVFSEPVEDPSQSLDDAEISYAKRGLFLLLKIKPFREEQIRYLVFNTATRVVLRIDAIGHSCVSLPEDHGLLFPGGYLLRTGEYKAFEAESVGLEFFRLVKSPNGEDVLYVFFRKEDGLYALYPYNLIRKEVATPLHAHGWSLAPDGTLVVFKAETEPTRVHPAQIWSTPFVSPEFHRAIPNDGSLLARIGNADLVRGISDALTLVRLIRNQTPTRGTYEELVNAANRFVDAFGWSGAPEVGDLRTLVEEVRRTAELVIDEFVKVLALRTEAEATLARARSAHDKVLGDLRAEGMARVGDFLAGMTRLRAHRGELITLREVKYVDVNTLAAFEAATVARFDEVSRATIAFLLGDGAFAPLLHELEGVAKAVEAVAKSHELEPLRVQLGTTTAGVALLGEVVAGLDVEDPTVKTRILEGIGEVVSHANRARALLDGRARSLRTVEGRASFGAQFRLFGQAVETALSDAPTPEACDEQLSRVLLQLEDLEARFGDLDEFLPALSEKRDEVLEAFEGRKQGLLEERQRRVSTLMAAAGRILEGIGRRARQFATEAELAAWFAADPMVEKLRGTVAQLRALGDTVKSDELEAKLVTARQTALRGLRDKLDLFDGDDLVRLGKHRFTVNTRPLELTLVPHDGGLALHLTGTDFHEPVTDAAFEATRPLWDQALASEDATVYRGEYLAFSLLDTASGTEEQLLAAVRAHAADRFDEGYERGIHDADAAKILHAVLGLRKTAGLLAFPSAARTLAALYWSFAPDRPAEAWTARARALVRLREALGRTDELQRTISELSARITAWLSNSGFPITDHPAAGACLVEVLAQDPVRFAFSTTAAALRDALLRWLEDHGGQMTFEDALRPLGDRFGDRFGVKRAWLEAFARRHGHDPALAGEAAALLLCGNRVTTDVGGGSGSVVVRGLLGQHSRIHDTALEVHLDEFLARLEAFGREKVPAFRAYRKLRGELVDRERARLRLSEFAPKVMTSFVRNQLVDQVYLPLVGDNLAKQLGAAGAGRRTDQMGLLLLVSPPGYGKTTLMEYVAARLGLAFVKVNGPALGHAVTSLDPEEAPNATARQEIEKVGLALEMANNVMLYLDDIQHCDPELLQKFISLCDGQRRIEAVWRGRTRTYDLRGKKFCIVMAGNPYTESGAKFKIPDMLANRADTYNLGDVLSGREEQFGLSFVENAVTSNPTLSPLAGRPPKDLLAFVRMAKGEEVPESELSQPYAGVERQAIVAVLQHLLRCQQTLLAVNAEYIRSAAMEDAYRTEPRFQLQGSYRNMNKLAEKVVQALTPPEVDALVVDHYQGESQTLTTGAESNLLKLAELRGALSTAQAVRWAEIKDEFRRRQVMGGTDDPAAKITGALSLVQKELRALRPEPAVPTDVGPLVAALERRRPTDLGPVVDALRSLAAATPAPADLDVEPLLHELRAIRSLLAATSVGVGPDEPTDEQGPVNARGQLLAHAHRALAEGLAGGRGTEGALVAALWVIEQLVVQMSEAARAHLEPEAHGVFVEALRRSVASAASELARTR
jgi:hypothetical protein